MTYLKQVRVNKDRVTSFLYGFSFAALEGLVIAQQVLRPLYVHTYGLRRLDGVSPARQTSKAFYQL